MGGKITQAVAPFGLRICVGFAEFIIFLYDNPSTAITFFNYRFKKTLHDI
jgi:hypothetical protein